ncbi:MAG: hypothetical protein ACPL4H_06560 [Anaerolineales bacterium]
MMRLATCARSNRPILLLIFIFFIALTACNSPSPIITSSPSVTEAPTLTALPTVSPTPQPSLLLLVAPSTSDKTFLDELQVILQSTAKTNGLHFETRNSLTPAELADQSIRLAVVVSADSDLANLAKTAPQTQFLAIGSTGLTPQTNLSVIELQPYRPDWEGFAAGFIAATVTEEWRVGIVSDNTTVEGKAAQNGFANGVKFMCGLCQPLYPPFPIPTYPLYWSLNATSGQEDIDAGVAYFQTWAIKTVYLYKPLDSWLSAFGSAGFKLISDQTPPENLQAQWIASIQNNNPLEEIKSLLPQLLDGKGGQISSSGLTLTNVNADLFSPGKQAYVADMLTDLLSGKIDSGVDPTTGELR